MDEKKNSSGFSNFVGNAVNLGKKATVNVKDSVSAMVEKSKADKTARKIKKYNPLFPDQFKSADFKLPNIIMIVDDAERRDIDVCEGAIGWLSKDSGSEVLYLYDEMIEFSGIQFIPTATCDAVYYVDSYNRNRFIRTDCVFSKAHEERMAELKNIAFSLGAKWCSIEITESSADTHTVSKSMKLNANIQGVKNKESFEQSSSQIEKDRRSGLIEVEFEGHASPQKPDLKWFKHDDNINRLIEMCCGEKRAIKTESLVLSGSSSATMSQKVASTLDCVIGKDTIKGSASMNAQAAREHQSKLYFHIVF